MSAKKKEKKRNMLYRWTGVNHWSQKTEKEIHGESKKREIMVHKAAGCNRLRECSHIIK